MKLKVIIGILISLIFLYIAFSGIDFSEFRDAIITANYWYFLAAMAISIPILYVRAYRWKYLLIRQKDIPVSTVFSATCIGFFANNVLPMRAGEFLRAYVIGRNEKVKTSSVIATILVERMIDVFSLLMIAAAGLLLLDIPHNEHYDKIKFFAVILFAIEMFVIAFCFMLVLKREFTLRISNRIIGIFPQRIHETGSRILDSFLDGLEFIKAPQHLFKLFWTTIAVWVLNCLIIYFIILAFDDLNFNATTIIASAIVVTIFTGISVTFPSAPGYVGTFHAFAKNGLGLFVNMDDISVASVATGFAVLLHLTTYIPFTVTGFYYLLRENVKLAVVKNRAADD